MRSHLRDIIESMNRELSDNIFIQYVDSLEENDFGTNENQDYLKNLYQDIVSFYKDLEKRENED